MLGRSYYLIDKNIVTLDLVTFCRQDWSDKKNCRAEICDVIADRPDGQPSLGEGN